MSPLHHLFPYQSAATRKEPDSDVIRTVLVVEPDPLTRQTIVAACDEEGLDCIGFSCEPDAIDWLWVRGPEVSAVYVNASYHMDQAVESLTEVLSRDWPSVIVYDDCNLAKLMYRLEKSERVDSFHKAKQVAGMLGQINIALKA